MANSFVTLKGELSWVRTTTPEVSPFTKPGQPVKEQWKTTIRPDQESLMKIMDMQAMGVKNKLGKDEANRYFITYNRPTEIPRKKGPSTKLEAPKVYQADGKTLITDFVGNGSKGEVTVELYEHATPNGGKAHAARLYSVTITDFIPYKSPEPQPESKGWGN